MQEELTPRNGVPAVLSTSARISEPEASTWLTNGSARYGLMTRGLNSVETSFLGTYGKKLTNARILRARTAPDYTAHWPCTYKCLIMLLEEFRFIENSFLAAAFGRKW